MKINEAAAWLHKGNIIFYPTEAVYGVGADPMNQAACASILDIKGRSSSAGFIIIASELQQLSSFIDSSVMSQLVHFKWPKHTTYILPKSKQCPTWLVGQFSTIACRITQHPTTRLLCEAFGGAIVSTSANPSGLPPARTKQALIDYFGKKSAIVSGRLGRAKKPSTIIDWATNQVLRD